MGETGLNVDLIPMIEKPLLETPFFGVRRMTWELRNDGHVVTFVKRLWRSLKCERVYLRAWDVGSEAKTGAGTGFDVCNNKRPGSAPGGNAPAVAFG